MDTQAAPAEHQKARPIVNIAGYQFVTLDRLHERRRTLREWCHELQLRGTILLAGEGINLFLAGTRPDIDTFLARLRSDPSLADFAVKESYSDNQPFRRTLVRLKKEIIAFGVPSVDASTSTGRRVAPKQLRQWLDAGEPVTLLDVRNAYEIKLGTFQHALPVGVDHFRDFPDAARRLPDTLKHQRVVTFCTGGIRCEKAAPFLEQLGFRDVYQLDGGILRYFEECGAKHYQGECFVFDRRVSLDPQLQETPAALCFACQAPLTETEQQSPLYVPGQSCPHCYQSPQEHQQQLLAHRRRQLDQVAVPLPGSIPYDNRRPLHVPGRFAGQPLIEFLCQMHPHVGRDAWQQICLEGRITINDRPADARQIVAAGQQYLHVLPETIEPDVNADISWIFEDDWLVVVNKPAPLPMHPCGRFNRNTLIHLLNAVYRPLRLRVAHRLDANTSGVVVLSKTRKVASVVQPQFEDGRVGKQYLARIIGHPNDQRFSCDAPIGTQRVAGGGRVVDRAGQAARTEFEVLRKLPDGTTLVQARPRTGRTNQIRIHLWHLGYPVCNDPLYLPGGNLGSRQALEVHAPAMQLHAQSLSLFHPVTHQAMQFTAATPPWATEA